MNKRNKMFNPNYAILSICPLFLCINFIDALNLTELLNNKFISVFNDPSWLRVFIITLLAIIIYLILRRKIYNLIKEKEKVVEQTKESLLEEKNQLHTLIDHMPDSIYIKDIDSRFLVANKHVAKVLGAKSAEQLIGKRDHDFVPKEFADIYYNDEQEIINTGKPLIGKEEAGIDENGNIRYVSTTKIPLRNTKGEIIGIVGIGRDISKQKEVEKALLEKAENLSDINQLLEERQEEIQTQTSELTNQRNKLMFEKTQLRTLIDNMPDIIYFKDKEAKIVLGNEAQVKVMKAKSQADIIGKTDYDFYPKEMADKFYHDDIEIIKTGNPIVNVEEEGYDFDGNKRVVSTTKIPLKNPQGEVIGLVGIGRDITKQKEVETQLIQQARDLQEINVLLEERQEEIQQQSEELNAQAENLREANAELERLNKTKNKFFSIIAHDLKNPFQAIFGFSELLTRNFRDLSEPKKLEILQLIRTSSESAYNLLENLLQWARTQTDRIKYTPENVILNELIEQNIGILSANAETKSIKIVNKVDENTQVYADRNMLNTIIRNLLNNAIKFSNNDSNVTFDVSSSSQEKKTTFSIADEGVGIEKKNIESLFKLDQFLSTSGTVGETGTGLGLIITKEFVDKNRGTINVESEIGKGTIFTITLPSKK